MEVGHFLVNIHYVGPIPLDDLSAALRSSGYWI
jgi:hypothetical protein